MVRMYTLLISRVLVVIACLILITSAQSYKPDSFTDYQNARDCVKGCVYSGLVDQAPLNLGCNQQNPVTCQCGSIGDVSNSLSRWIWTCASTGCGDDPEASSAVAIFHEYCVANLSPTAQPTSSSSSPAVTAGPTPGGTTVIAAPTVTATVTVKSSSSSLSTQLSSSTFVSTPTLFTDVSTPDSTGPGTSYTTRTISTSAQSDSGTGGSGVGLGQADRIALGVGLSVPLAALLVTIYTCVRRQEP